MNYRETLELGRCILDISMEAVKEKHDMKYFESFLKGESASAIAIRDQRGWMVNDCNAVLQAIYSYYKTNPEEHIDRLTENALINIFKTCSQISFVQNTARVVQYHLNNEQQKTAPFHMDCTTILQEYHNNIERNKCAYQRKADYAEFDSIDEEITRIMSLMNKRASSSSAVKNVLAKLRFRK